MENLVLGAYYKLYSLKDREILVRPIIETESNINFYIAEQKSILLLPKPLKNKIIFVRGAVLDELKQLKKDVNKIYRKKYGTNFTGNFIKTEINSLALSEEPNNSRDLRRKLREDIEAAKINKVSLAKRYIELVNKLKNTTIKSERSEIYKLLKIVSADRKALRETIKDLVLKKRNS